MVDITQLLAGSMQDENDYLAQSPFFLGGVNLAKQQVAPRNNTEAFLLPLLQGLGSGVLMGYGRKEAQDEAFKEYKSSPFLSALSGYQTEERPENWTPRQGKLDIYAALLANEQNQALEIEQQKAKNDLQKTLLGKGVALSPEGGVVPISGLAEAEAQASALKKRQEVQAEKEATINALGYNPETKKEADDRRAEVLKLPTAQSLQKSLSVLPLLESYKNDDTGTSDIPFIYQFVQAQDGGVVKEGEFNLVQGASPILQKYSNQLNGALNGASKLTVALKTQMVKKKKKATLLRKKSLDKEAEPIFKLAEKRGASREDVNPFDNRALLESLAIPTGKFHKDGRPIVIIDGVEGVID
mgnify:FL=1